MQDNLLSLTIEPMSWWQKLSTFLYRPASEAFRHGTTATKHPSRLYHVEVRPAFVDKVVLPIRSLRITNPAHGEKDDPRVRPSPLMNALQAYLGFSPHTKTSESAQTGLAILDNAFDIDKPAPHPFKSDPIFICIDLEAFERAIHKITEIGIATLDTRYLKDLAPGPNGANWIAKTQCKHLRISEHLNLLNKRFVKGCPDKFNFGVSQTVSLSDARGILERVFATGCDTAGVVEKRNVVIVGHDLPSDIKFLKRLDFSPFAAGTVVGQLDTQNLAGSTKKFTIGLERLLRMLGQDPVHL